MGQSTVVVDGVDTGVRVDFDTSPDGVISNVRPASESMLNNLSKLPVSALHHQSKLSRADPMSQSLSKQEPLISNLSTKHRQEI